MDSWNCVVVCRRMRGGVDEVLVQWECSWVAAEEAPPGEIVRVLMRRVVGQQTAPDRASSKRGTRGTSTHPDCQTNPAAS